MAFSLKTWVNRISEYPNRRKLTHEDGSTELVTVSRAEGQISAEGNAFSAEEMNDLENRIKGGFDEVNQSLTYKTTATASTTYVTQNLKLNKQNRTAYLNGQIIINTTISGNQTALFTIDNECEPYVYKHNQTWVPLLGIATNGKLYPFFLKQNCGVYFIEGITYPAGTSITFNEKWLTD